MKALLKKTILASALFLVFLAVGADSASASTVTRSFSNATPTAGTSLDVTLTVGVTAPDTFYFIDEVFPAGWVISNPGTGSTTQAGHIKWAVILGATSTVYNYTINVPASALGANTFSGEYLFDSNNNVAVPIGGATSVNVQSATVIYDITTSAGANGTISPSGVVGVNGGSDQVFNITPNAGYGVADVLVDGVSVGSLTSYTFTNVLATHTISASFSLLPPVVPSTVTRSFSNATPTAGTSLDVTLTVAVNASDTFYFIDEVIPAGWVISNSGTGDTTQAGHIKWPVISGATSTVLNYTVDVPVSAVGIYNFSGEYLFDSNNNVAVPIGGDSTVNVTAAPDTTPPVIDNVLDMTVQATSSAGATVNYTVPNATDNIDPVVVVTCLPASGSTFPLGITTVTCNASDASGNPAVPETFTVNVVDTTAPTIANVLDMIVEATSPAGATVNYTAPTATDNADLAVVVTCLPASGSVFPLGINTVTCNASDASSNPAISETFTVTVQDTTAPVITMNGTNLTIEVGTVYVDAGATASDNYYGDITGSIVTVNSVNANAVGVYTVTYNVTDASGVPAIQVTRTVTVQDTTAPVITLTGANPQAILLGAGYSELGATTDDGSAVTINATAFVDAVGSYGITYDATDAAGNSAVQVIRTVNVFDATATLVSIAITTPATKLAYKVGDALDISGMVVTGTYSDASTRVETITGADVSGFDSSAVTVSQILTVTVGGKTATFTISIDKADSITTVTCPVSEAYTGVAIEPCAVLVTGAGGLNFATSATYLSNTNVGTASASYTFAGDANHNGSTDTDTFEITAKTLTVTANDQTKIYGESDPFFTFAYAGFVPGETSAVLDVEPTCLVSSLIYENVGSYLIVCSGGVDGNYAFEYFDGLLSVTAKTINVTADAQSKNFGDSDPALTYTSTPALVGADTFSGSLTRDAGETVGTYAITQGTLALSSNYSLNYVGANLTIVDTDNPIITLVGSDPVTIEVHTPYVDAGATASDNLDGNLTASIVTVNPVNVDVVGAYVITYNVTDANGNAATEVTRTVNVVDTTAPTIDNVPDMIVEATSTIGAVVTITPPMSHDAVDGDLPAVCNYSTGMFPMGVTTVTCTKTDTSGNVATPETFAVTIEDTTAPAVNAGLDQTRSTIFTQDATVTDSGSGIASYAWTQTSGPGTIIFGTPSAQDTTVLADLFGIYVMRLTVTDLAGNSAFDEFTLNQVLDAVPPVITLLGSAYQEVQEGDSFADAGATALDNLDGDITSAIVVTGSVNVNVAGTYTLRYNVTDAAGNSADEVIRTVKVVAKGDGTPEEVSNLEAEYESETQCVRLSWNLDQDNADEVRIYRSTRESFSANSDSEIGEQDADDESFRDCDVESGEKYYYKVVVLGKDRDNKSDSKRVSIQIPFDIFNQEAPQFGSIFDQGNESDENVGDLEGSQNGGTTQDNQGQVKGEEAGTDEGLGESEKSAWNFLKWLIPAILLGGLAWWWVKRRK